MGAAPNSPARRAERLRAIPPPWGALPGERPLRTVRGAAGPMDAERSSARPVRPRWGGKVVACRCDGDPAGGPSPSSNGARIVTGEFAGWPSPRGGTKRDNVGSRLFLPGRGFACLRWMTQSPISAIGWEPGHVGAVCVGGHEPLRGRRSRASSNSRVGSDSRAAPPQSRRTFLGRPPSLRCVRR